MRVDSAIVMTRARMNDTTWCGLLCCGNKRKRGTIGARVITIAESTRIQRPSRLLT